MTALEHLHELARATRARRDQLLVICSTDDGQTHLDFARNQAMASMCDVLLLDIATQITKALGPASTAQAA